MATRIAQNYNGNRKAGFYLINAYTGKQVSPVFKTIKEAHKAATRLVEYAK